ncbi:MAG TPA: plastocyanin/azurin family copper-binding protein [Candidatus Kapabacteria bacterium]|jgi:plastocyanin|nr:plastocyanin/azurin family copper-binding protein [Candidatus Kapabacteria bacterium]
MKRFYYIFLTVIFLAAGTAQAKTVSISFGNFFFNPQTVNVNVGDVIEWTGNSGHTITSTTIPSGAAAFNKSDLSVTTFSYTVTVAGTYNYVCTVHQSLGMTGSFTAGSAGVETPADTKLMMDPIFPNPSSMESMVHFTLANSGHVTLRVFDATGKLAMTPVDEEMDAGFHMVMLDTKPLASGSYQYVLQQGEAVLRREMIVVK